MLRPVAVADLTEAHAHHSRLADGLGDRFVAGVDELFARLREFPRSAPLVAGYRDVRRAVVRGFPYVIFYRYEPYRIDVLRVLHAARSDADRPPGVHRR
ncbi:MAG: type II toxin-antitoxin system RelE/ParE family toxin [Nitriliruptoraceae bacterium]